MAACKSGNLETVQWLAARVPAAYLTAMDQVCVRRFARDVSCCLFVALVNPTVIAVRVELPCSRI